MKLGDGQVRSLFSLVHGHSTSFGSMNLQNSNLVRLTSSNIALALLKLILLTENCYIWRPIAPEGYVALGDVVTTKKEPPERNTIRCVNRRFLHPSKHCSMSKERKFLWSNEGSSKIRSSSAVSIWLTKPRLDSLWCNVFRCIPGYHPPDSGMFCLKLAVAGTQGKLLEKKPRPVN